MKELTAMQAAYWVGRQSEASTTSVSAHLYGEFDSAGLDQNRLKKAAERLFRRHEMLRMRITEEGRQTICPANERHTLIIDDMRDLSDAVIAQRLEEKRHQKSAQQLPLDCDHPFELELSLLPEGHCRLHIDLDMAAVDPSCFPLLLDDLARFYETPSENSHLPSTYFDYLERRRQDPVQRALHERDARWWRNRLDGIPPAPPLPWLKRQPSTKTHPGRFAIQLDNVERDRCERLARQHRLTLSTLFLTLFAGTLAAWTDCAHYRLNVPMFYCHPIVDEVDRLAGDFSNLLVLGVDLRADSSLIELCRQVADEMTCLLSHSAYPGVSVMRDLSRHCGDIQVSPVVFTAGLDLPQKHLFSERVERTFGELSWVISQGPHVALDVQLATLRDGILINWDVSLDALPATWVENLFNAYVAVIRYVIEVPEAMTHPFKPIFAAFRDHGQFEATEPSPCLEQMLLLLLRRLSPSSRIDLETDIWSQTTQTDALDNLSAFINRYLPSAALCRADFYAQRTPSQLIRLIRQRAGEYSERIANAFIESVHLEA